MPVNSDSLFTTNSGVNVSVISIGLSTKSSQGNSFIILLQSLSLLHKKGKSLCVCGKPKWQKSLSIGKFCLSISLSLSNHASLIGVSEGIIVYSKKSLYPSWTFTCNGFLKIILILFMLSSLCYYRIVLPLLKFNNTSEFIKQLITLVRDYKDICIFANSV